MKKLRVAVIGCGNVSRGHIRAWLQENKRAEIVALVDVAPKLARQRQVDFKLAKAKVLKDLAAALSRPDVDVVDLCTPSHLHADQIAAALEAGKHIVTEKPTGYNLEECRRLRWQALRHPGLKVAVAYSLRYYPLNIKVHELVHGGAIGRVLYAEAAHNHPHDFSADAVGGRPSLYHDFEDAGGGYLPGSEMTGATHVWDLMRYLFGEVQDVLALHGPGATIGLMRFQSGALGKATAGSGSSKGIATPHVLCIQGTEGTIITQNAHQFTEKGQVLGYTGTIVTDGKPRPIEVSASDTSHGDATRTRNFLDAIEKNAPLICSLEDGIRTSELLHALWDSANLEIRVPVHRSGKTG